MADLSNSNNRTSYEELLEEYRQERNQVDERLFLSCYRKTEQGIIKINEWQPPSTIDLLKEMKSSCTVSDFLSDYVNYLINEEDNEDLDFVSDECIINPCNEDLLVLLSLKAKI